MPPLPSKKEVVLALLERSSVFVHLDPRRDQVVVPTWFKKQPRLVLQIGLNMPVPIRDLSVDDECVSCTLSFNRSPFFCWIPWSAVFALVGEDQRGIVWPDDVPPELDVPGEGGRAQSEQHRKRPDRPHLRAVTSGDSVPAPSSPPAATPEPAAPVAADELAAGNSGNPDEPAAPPPPAEESRPAQSKRPPHLRLVK